MTSDERRQSDEETVRQLREAERAFLESVRLQGEAILLRRREEKRRQEREAAVYALWVAALFFLLLLSVVLGLLGATP